MMYPKATSRMDAEVKRNAAPGFALLVSLSYAVLSRTCKNKPGDRSFFADETETCGKYLAQLGEWLDAGRITAAPLHLLTCLGSLSLPYL